MPISAHDVGANWYMSGWRGSQLLLFVSVQVNFFGEQYGTPTWASIRNFRNWIALKITNMNRLNWKNTVIHLRARLWRSSMTLLKAQSSLTLVRGLGYKVIRWAERRARRNKVGAWSMLDPCKACIIITMEADHGWYNLPDKLPEELHDKFKAFLPCPEMMAPNGELFSDYQKKLVKRIKLRLIRKILK